MGYLSCCNAGGPIEPLNYRTSTRCPFLWDFPQLDFKVLNNSPNTIYLTELILDVEESVLDPLPIIAIKADVVRQYAGHFHLYNEGWCDLQDVTIQLRWSQERLQPCLRKTTGRIHLPILLARCRIAEVWIEEAFQQMGVDYDGLERLSKADWVDNEHLTASDENGVVTTISKDEYDIRWKQCLGPFQDGVGTVVGEIDFIATAIDGKADKR